MKGIRALVFTFIVVFFAATGFAQSDKALMLTVFGTSTEAAVTFDRLLPLVQKQYPERDVVVPYTSRIIREKLNAATADSSKKILSPAEMLEKLKSEGYKDIAVVSTILFPGVEHERLKEIVDSFHSANSGIKVSYTAPLLSDPANLQPVINTLGKYIINDGVNVVVSHGTHDGHAAEATYKQLADLVATTYPNARLGSVEGVPAMADVLDWVKQSHADNVRFLVFMFVAGDHAQNDIAGAEEDSLFSAVKSMGKMPSVAWVENGGKHIASLGLDPEYRKLLLQYYARNVAQ